MGNSFTKLERHIKKNKFQIIAVVSLIVLIILWVTNKDKKGTYTGLSDEDIMELERIGKTQRKEHKPLDKNERRCREIIESIYQAPFPKQRPNFLMGEKGKPLELDMYNDDLKIAFEYNGIQHYKYTPRFHKNEEDLVSQRQRDILKEKLCIENGIKLYIIPYTVRYNDLESHIRGLISNNELNNNNLFNIH